MARSTCQEIETSLSVDKAHVILEPYFVASGEIFEEWDKRTHGRGAKLKAIRLEIAPWAHDSPRHFAATTEDGHSIIAAPEMAELPEETILAIFSHELGHALDFLYPAHFFWVDDKLEHGGIPEEIELEQLQSDKRIRQALYARVKRWQARDADEVELSADAIAELVTGKYIGYQGPCMLQSFDRGSRRPRGLR